MFPHSFVRDKVNRGTYFENSKVSKFLSEQFQVNIYDFQIKGILQIENVSTFILPQCLSKNGYPILETHSNPCLKLSPLFNTILRFPLLRWAFKKFKRAAYTYVHIHMYVLLS